MDRISVLLADDHTIFRQGLRMLLAQEDDIEVVGEDVSRVNFGFRVGHNFASRFGHALWFTPLKKFQRLFFRTPLVYLFVMGSYFYHDFVWWRFKGTGLMRELREKSKWGRLFESY